MTPSATSDLPERRVSYYPGQFYPGSWVEVALWCNWMPPGGSEMKELPISAAPERERCRTHNHVRDTWTECRACRGLGETYREPDYEGDWVSGYHRCYSCGGAGGYYECFLCLEEGDDY